MQKTCGNFLSTYQLSPGYKNLLEKMLTKPENFRILPLPMSLSPYYLKTEHQNEGQGGDPILMNSKKPFIGVDFFNNKLATLIEKLFYTQNLSPNISKLLGLSNVKYIVLRKDVRPHFGPYAYNWDYPQVYSNLAQMKNVELLKEYKYISLYKNLDFVPHIYTSFIPTIVDGDVEALMSLTEAKCLDGKPALMFVKQIPDTGYKMPVKEANNFVFKDTEWRDLAVEMTYCLSLMANGKEKIKVEKSGTYEFWLDTSELEEISEFEIEIDGELALSSSLLAHSKDRKYVKFGEVKLEGGKHDITVHSLQSTIHSQEDKKIKIVLVNKEERERVEKEIWKRINQPEAEVCYIFEKEGAQFYVP